MGSRGALLIRDRFGDTCGGGARRDAAVQRHQALSQQDLGTGAAALQHHWTGLLKYFWGEVTKTGFSSVLGAVEGARVWRVVRPFDIHLETRLEHRIR